MALVLRKALLPKHMSMLKCMKGRPLASTANRKNAPALITAVPCRSMRNKVFQTYRKISKAKQLSAVCNRRIRAKVLNTRYCISCPNMIKTKMLKPLRRCFSSPRNGFIIHEDMAIKPISKLFQTHATCTLNKRGFSTKPSSPCPCPCPCGGCLPPPCNTPAKCIQYMTGYYYYPYGFWFCGPYHVTGTCGACGPCSPGSCPCPCPCAKCCACLAPTLSAVVDSRPLPEPPSRPICPPRPQYTPIKPQAPQSGTPNMQFRQVFESPVFQDCYQVNKNNPTCKQAKRSSISKYFPFQLSQDNAKPAKANQICPYSTQISSTQRKPTCCKCPQSSYRKIHMKNPEMHCIDPFPKNPKKYLSGAYSRSFSGHEGNSSCGKCRRGHVCPPLKKPKVMLTPEQRDRPFIEPGLFSYAAVPHFINPYPDLK